MVTAPSLMRYDSADVQDACLAQEVATLLDNAIEQRGEAWLVVSGGRTPDGFFHYLSEADIDWSKVTVTLADERWVELQHQDSNERLVRDSLLINKAERAHFLSLHCWNDCPYEGLETVRERLRGMPTFDVVVLGLGNDGHTASLFPRAEELQDAFQTTQPCVALTPITAPYRRMTLSLNRLLNSRKIFVQLRGEDKHQVYERAMAETDPYVMPVVAVLKQTQTPVKVTYAPAKKDEAKKSPQQEGN